VRQRIVRRLGAVRLSLEVDNMMFNKAQSDTMKVVMVAALLITLLLIGLYFAAKVAKTGKEVSGCGGYTCSVDGSCPEGQVASLTSCTNSTLKKDGRCCTVSPV